MKEKLRHRIKNKVKERIAERRRIIFSFSLMLAVMLVVSLTIGRQLLAGNEPGLNAFALIHFLGYLFFILMPVEALFPFYLAEGHSGIILIILAVLTALLAQLFDYAIGYLFSEKIIDRLIGKKRHEKMERAIEKYGTWAVFFFNVTPLSSPILVLTAGMVRMRWRTVIIYSALGLTIKYIIIVYFFGNGGLLSLGS